MAWHHAPWFTSSSTTGLGVLCHLPLLDKKLGTPGATEPSAEQAQCYGIVCPKHRNCSVCDRFQKDLKAHLSSVPVIDSCNMSCFLLIMTV